MANGTRTIMRTIKPGDKLRLKKLEDMPFVYSYADDENYVKSKNNLYITTSMINFIKKYGGKLVTVNKRNLKDLQGDEQWFEIDDKMGYTWSSLMFDLGPNPLSGITKILFK